MNVVPNLLSLIAEDSIGLTTESRLDEIRQESMQLDTTVLGSGQATASKDTDLEPEISPIFLRHDVGSHLRRTENRMHTAINSAGFRDSFPILRARIFPPRFE